MVKKKGGKGASEPPFFMKRLSIDIETYSSVNLAKAGVYKYTEACDFEILLFGYAVDGGEVHVVDLAQGELLPPEIIKALTDNNVTKWAYNAAFERVCLSAYLWRHYPHEFKSYGDGSDAVSHYLDPAGWKCTMIWSAYLGLPLSLEKVGAVLRFEEQKLKEGKELIRYFCMPCRGTKANGGRGRNLPCHSFEKWAVFKKYNKRDVEVEMSIQNKLAKYPVPDAVWDEYHIDQQINDRGILLDMELVRNAIDIDKVCAQENLGKLRKLTGLENPNSVSQLRAWLEDKGVPTESLGKKAVSSMLPKAHGAVKEALILRQKSAKSSIKKYQAMDDCACEDHRARGMFQFYGANRTGRFSGRHIQLQNLVRNEIPELDAARGLVKMGDYGTLDMLYESIPDVLSQLIRTAFIAKPGYKFIVSDFSAIEARVLSHLAGEKWRSKVFESGGDIYCASASAMFHVPVVKHGVNGELRQKGKIAELALGYGGAAGALKAMGALDMGLQEEELKPLVDSWRGANPHIVEFWWEVDRAIKMAVQDHKPVDLPYGICVYCQGGFLFIRLPSGRKLAYVSPKMGMNKFGSPAVTYLGIGATKKWERIESYGPKFVENIVQAVSRDILCYAMKSLRNEFICGHVHDELIIECPVSAKVETICSIMGRTPPWIQGLVLRADGYETPYYMKD